MKAYEILQQVKDLCLYSTTGTSRDNMILQRLNMVQNNLYTMPRFWRALEGRVDLYTTELMTLNVAPTTPWAVGDTITGATSTKTCVIVEVLSTTTFNVKDRSGTFTLGEILSNGTTTADQGLLFPTFAWNNYTTLPSDIGIIFDLRQMTTSPYSKLTYLDPHTFHATIPQPSMYASGQPTCYTWWDRRLWWYPVPDDDYTMTMYYYKKPTNMKIYNTGTAAVAATGVVTGTSTFFSTNANVVAGMHFTIASDTLSDGTFTWAEIGLVSSATLLTLKNVYAGTGGGTTVAYVCSSAPTFPSEFDSYLIYATTLMEIGRLREMSELRGWLKEQLSDILPGLIRNQTYIPDWNPTLQNFTQGGIILGADYAKFPFISVNP